MWKIMIFAGIGGFAGTCCRFLINKLCALLFNTPFPFATFIINITGCFLLGLLSGFFAKQGIVSPRLNAFLIVGFCGGFTTFSTFSLESLNLGISGLMSVSMLYIAASIVLGLLAVWCGMIITNH
ncbi:MAG: fluoride efflux transporter CrcB [Muribaculaceae bacterium]|nr:fluoride efflux transporter CrcB [Muribaculaceae bacterium]